MGDGLSITITAMALLLMSGQGLPSWSAFLMYMMYYCIVKFSAAGVPGGGVIVILPVVRDYLGLDEATTSLLATIYMLQDPILTSANVMGNGAFAMVTHRLLKPFLRGKTPIDTDDAAKTVLDVLPITRKSVL
jgi:Na+/H+-dicarboxylate symporter